MTIGAEPHDFGGKTAIHDRVKRYGIAPQQGPRGRR